MVSLAMLTLSPALLPTVPAPTVGVVASFTPPTVYAILNTLRIEGRFHLAPHGHLPFLLSGVYCDSLRSACPPWPAHPFHHEARITSSSCRSLTKESASCSPSTKAADCWRTASTTRRDAPSCTP